MSRRPGTGNKSHQAGVCACRGCNHPLLVNPPPAVPKGPEARRERLQRIMREEQAWKRT